MFNSFSFQTVKSLLVEAGAAQRLGEIALQHAMHSVLLVSDAGVKRLGLLDAALASLQASDIAVTLFTEVTADPTAAMVEAAAAAARAAGADGVIGIGGGSPMDVAKLAALLARDGQPLDTLYGVGLASGQRLPLILIPTTAGTGSEVTPVAIVTTASGEKKGVVSPLLLPDCALLDALLTLGLPQPVTAATGIDAMVHAIEAYTSRRLKNPISDCLALDALRLLSANIVRACEQGQDVAAREAMLLGACLAGMAFANAPVAAVHALAYPVGALFHVPHGLSNSLLLPGVLAFNLTEARPLYAQLARAVVPDAHGDIDELADALLRTMTRLPLQLGLPTRLADVGIGADDLPKLAGDAMKQTRLLVNNPREMTYDAALAIYQEAL
ncbi:iron-containing alcohol dehydrogenase [Pseudomonas gingeri]